MFDELAHKEPRPRHPNAQVPVSPGSVGRGLCPSKPYGKFLMRAWLVLLFLALPSFGSPQLTTPVPPSAPDQQYRFSVSVQMVVLQATVVTGKGSLVKGLGQRNFQLYEDDRQQIIKLFRHSDSPVAIRKMSSLS
jgi:hypothetical protein